MQQSDSVKSSQLIESKRPPIVMKSKPKRFQIVDSLNDNYSPEASAEADEEMGAGEAKTTESMGSLSEEVTTRRLIKKSRPRNPNKPEHYIQGHTRQLTEGLDFRKRLPYFLPKRYHWDPDHYKDLGYFWFNGMQGPDPPGAWKIAY